MYLKGILLSLTRKCNISHLNFIQERKMHLHYIDKKYTSLILINSSHYSSDDSLKCWNCNFVRKSDLFCSNCKVLQAAPKNLTYFELLSIPKSYDVTVPVIQKKYKELQKLLHPDKFSTKSEMEKQISETLSSLVNKAYSTLSHPLKRGFYMLKLNDIIISEETDNVNAEFLMEIMEKNEEVEDAMNDVTKIKQLVQENQTMLNSLAMEVTDAFKQKDIKRAEAVLIKMKYYYTINNRLKKLKHDLGIVE